MASCVMELAHEAGQQTQEAADRPLKAPRLSAPSSSDHRAAPPGPAPGPSPAAVPGSASYEDFPAEAWAESRAVHGLMPKQKFLYTSCYCEENCYLLLRVLVARGLAPSLDDLFVAFISNPKQQTPLWCQRAGVKQGRADGFVLWDYHVIVLQRATASPPPGHRQQRQCQQQQAEHHCNGGAQAHPERPTHVMDAAAASPATRHESHGGAVHSFVPSAAAPPASNSSSSSGGSSTPLVWDLDTTLPFPCPLGRYAQQALLPVQDAYARRYRLVPARTLLEHFASDRHHMLRPDGTWMAPPPPYPPIVCTGGAAHNLDRYWDVRQPWEHVPDADGSDGSEGNNSDAGGVLDGVWDSTEGEYGGIGTLGALVRSSGVYGVVLSEVQLIEAFCGNGEGS